MVPKFKELTLKEEAEWIQIMLIASPEIAENAIRLREAQEFVNIGTAMALGFIS